MPKKLPAPLLFLDLFQDVSDIIVSTSADRLGPCDVTHSLSIDEFECESLSGRETYLIFVPMQKNAHQLQMCPGTKPKRSITEEWSLGHRVSSCTCPQQSIIQALYCALCAFTVKTCIETDLNCVRKLVVMRAEISATTEFVQRRGVRLLAVQRDRMRDLKIDVVLKVIQRFTRRWSWTVKPRKDVWNPVKSLEHLQKLNYRLTSRQH